MKHLIDIEIYTPRSVEKKYRQVLKKSALATLQKMPKLAFKKLKEGTRYTMVVGFGTDAQIKKLNSHYRGKNKSTDVLSFSRLDGSPFPVPHQEVGDVILSLSIAKKQAREYGVSLKEELSRLTVHGVLHLFGYDHEMSPKEERRMFRLQEKILKML